MLLGGVGAGLGLRREMKTGLEVLAELCSALGVLAIEISELKAPLPELFFRLSQTGPPRLGEFFRENADAAARGELERGWINAADALPICAQAAQALKRLGLSLGKYDAERQTGEIRVVREALVSIYEEERRRFAEGSRIYPGIGACFGAMLAIMLL